VKAQKIENRKNFFLLLEKRKKKRNRKRNRKERKESHHLFIDIVELKPLRKILNSYHEL